MYERYHVPKKEMAPPGTPFSKSLVVRSDRCMNCGKCLEACIYSVHERDAKDFRLMAEPKSHLCKNCLRCVENCPQRALTVELSPQYLALGGGVWMPQRVFTIWNEAWTGKIPVFGAGYRGRYVGPGYDSMWTDMSEIVRPTRDGIHGREFISTSVDLGKRVDHLEFDASGRLLTEMPRFVELPIPMLMDVTRNQDLTASMEGLAQAAHALSTLIIVPASAPSPKAAEAASSLVPKFPVGKVSAPTAIAHPKMVEMEMSPDWVSEMRLLRKRFPEAVVAVRLEAKSGVEKIVIEIASADVDIIHVLFDEQGQESGASPRLAKDSLLAINKALVSQSLRESISIITGGGLAAAEHVPKTIICGADAVVLERALNVAQGCHACVHCSKHDCPIKDFRPSPDWTKWRAVNMVGAWRDQLLEVMGAMGIREVRRLRGEIGRAIFYEEAEKDAFSSIPGGA
jgi:ferredoxin